MNPSGNLVLHNTVKFGSGDGPILYNVWITRYEFLVTSVLPSIPIPPIDSVTHTGSPLNNASYSGVLKNLTSLNFITKWSIISCTSASVIVPFFKSLSKYISKNVDTLPILIAAPFCCFIAAKYAKYVHCTASFEFLAGLEISYPYLFAISFNSSNAIICVNISSLNLIISSDIFSAVVLL